MEASYVSMILFVSRAWDAVTDPLVGYLCYNVPYLSLGMFLGGDPTDRDSATAYRMSVKMAATLLASVMQGQVIAVYNTEKHESCGRLGQAHEPGAQSTSSPQTAPLQKTLFIPAVIIVACVPSNLPVFMMMCVLMGFSVATMFLLPWSMLPDVVDDFVARHPSCRDMEPMFFSCYAFCSKLAGGLSVGVSTMTLQFVGYRAGACNHGDGSDCAVLASSHRTSADRDGLFSLLSNQREAMFAASGTTDPNAPRSFILIIGPKRKRNAAISSAAP
ncbi:Sodium-dependent lysophosphatidylcholine symporter 1 [Liparis tanakae]|uniref:Sodium-dependent lysophosphatidylcholine symporter 1 n=1 Tax=Liparis tanakae TaxID=230148 RepID=A0A4Z2I5H5_9TELE|nr:Sodium-dependent lysophosphatidylcholine symporter 1 [Liparis tanakae]